MPTARSKTCRICLEVEVEHLNASSSPSSAPAPVQSLIAPCHCRGTARWVHRTCLDAWREAARGSVAKRDKCTVCGFAYRIERGSAAYLPSWFVGMVGKMGWKIPGVGKGLSGLGMLQGLANVAVWIISDVADSYPFRVALSLSLALVVAVLSGYLLKTLVLFTDFTLLQLLRSALDAFPPPSDLALDSGTIGSILLTRMLEEGGTQVDLLAELNQIFLHSNPMSPEHLQAGILLIGCIANAYVIWKGVRMMLGIDDQDQHPQPQQVVVLQPHLVPAPPPPRREAGDNPFAIVLDWNIKFFLLAFWWFYGYIASKFSGLLSFLPQPPPSSDAPFSAHLIAIANFHLVFVRWATVSVGVGGIAMPRLWEWAGEKGWSWGGFGGRVLDLRAGVVDDDEEADDLEEDEAGSSVAGMVGGEDKKDI